MLSSLKSRLIKAYAAPQIWSTKVGISDASFALLSRLTVVNTRDKTLIFPRFMILSFRSTMDVEFSQGRGIIPLLKEYIKTRNWRGASIPPWRMEDNLARRWDWCEEIFNNQIMCVTSNENGWQPSARTATIFCLKVLLLQFSLFMWWKRTMIPGK